MSSSRNVGGCSSPWGQCAKVELYDEFIKTVRDIESRSHQWSQYRLSKGIAFWHPCCPHTPVFLTGDMPHVVKRIVNCLENSNLGPELLICVPHVHSGNQSTRSLIFVEKDPSDPAKYRRQPLCLNIAADAWTWDKEKDVGLRKTRFTEEHFHKDPWSRMRCSLAFQVRCSPSSRPKCRRLGSQCECYPNG